MKKNQTTNDPKIDEVDPQDELEDIGYKRPLLPEIKIDEKDDKNIELTRLINFFHLILDKFLENY
jgi:hypothetical protein